MGADEVDLSYEFVKQAANHPGVLAQLGVVAERVKLRAEGIAASEGVEMKIKLVTGVRPEGRPFVDLVSEDDEQEFGTSRIGRLRILGRAAEAG